MTTETTDLKDEPEELVAPVTNKPNDFKGDPETKVAAAAESTEPTDLKN